MKFSELPYERPRIEDVRAFSAKILRKIETAATAREQIAAYREYDGYGKTVATAFTLANIRHTVDTRDEFYDAENDYIDEISPEVQELGRRIDLALLASPHRAELEKEFGALLFKNLEISVRAMSPEIMELMQEENRLASEYNKLYASAMVDWRGEKIPLPKLGPFKQSPDRAVRRAAYETEGRWFDAQREKLDGLYDKLVKCRDAQARAMGYENFIPLGYDRMGRNCYGPEQVAAFREQIARDLVPIAARVKAAQGKRLGVDKLRLYDDAMRFPDGNAAPQGTSDDILAAGREMYRELSPETDEFAAFLYGGELLDVLSKPGKAPGGYCTDLAAYQAPFIFSNFNGTSGDVDVLTHEAGHAFAYYRSSRQGYISELISPGAESCEVHSMSMEFLTAPWHGRFFGPLTKKYELAHCEDALTFLPYGCMVDEFQHRVYESPEMTPEQRNALWLELEKKYRPWMDYDNLPFYSRGALWQRQLHIYLNPFYYIDYCMAQTVALQFWLASMENRDGAWRRYLTLVDAGGTKTFEQLVASAGMRLPYDEGCVGAVGAAIERWLEENQI